MKISNKHLTASFKTKGAELCSLKKGDQQYIWQADPVHWNRHAPVLFPIVGKLKNNTFLHDGNIYEMGQHGFARDYEFEVVAQDRAFVSFSLKASEESLKVYPFRFELIISYHLKDSSLITSYEVKNSDKKELFFSIGGHPAFNCPLASGENRSDYGLLFNQKEEFVTHRLRDGNFSGEKEKIGEGVEIRLTDNIFDKDALVFKNLNSNQVSLQNKKKKWLTFHFDGFPYLGIWSKSDVSPFVCIEPWYGLADYTDHNQELQEKEGIQVLAPAKSFSCSYEVEIH